jgi:eukaryotic-like serine/threonine-protein kinase
VGAPRRRGVVVAGQRLGRYTVTEKIGQGGMGTVWSAWDPELARELALKVLRTDYDDPVYHARVIREAQSLARLAHPNVVPVYDVGIDFGLLWVAMQRVRGTTLTQWLERPRPWQQIVEAFVQAAHGLAAAHEAGLVHRDFKPGNAMIDDDHAPDAIGRVMVLDFGLAWAPGVEGARTGAPVVESAGADITSPVARHHGSASGRDPLAYTLTASDAVVGTPPYMAPEQHCSREVDARTDQYALCVSMYEGLFGRRPFRGELAAMLAAKLEGAPPRPSQLPQLPEALWRVIARGMAADPSERWPDLATMSAAIERALRRPRRAPWAIAGTVLVIGGVAAAMPASSADPCASAGASLQRVWNDARKAELTASFGGDARSYSNDAATRVADRLDAAVATWQAQARAACTAAPDDPLATACVDRAALAVDAALEVLQQPDDARIARAPRMIESLVARHPCDQASDGAPVIDAELGRTYERARALMATGALADARALGRELMREANERGDAVALARALLVIGGASMDMGEWEEAQQRLTDALWTATASGDDEAVTTASTKLVELCVYRYDPECAKPWIRNAEAGLARLGARGELQRSELELALGDVVLREGDPENALVHYQRALELRVAAGGEAQLFVAVMLHAIGGAHAQAGRHEQALASYQRAAELEARLLGERDSGRAITLELTAGSLNALGRNAEARAIYEQALALVDAAYGEQSRHAIRMRGNLVLILADAGELDDALALARQVVVLKRAAFGEHDVQVAMGLHNLAMVESRRGDHEAACRDDGEALALWERALGPEHIDLVHPLAGLAHCERGRARADAALQHAQRAERLLVAAARPLAPELAADLAWALAEREATPRDARPGSDRTGPRTHAP